MVVTGQVVTVWKVITVTTEPSGADEETGATEGIGVSGGNVRVFVISPGVLTAREASGEEV